MLKIVTTYGRARYINAFQILEVEINLRDEVVVTFSNGKQETVKGELRDILSSIDAILYK